MLTPNQSLRLSIMYFLFLTFMSSIYLKGFNKLVSIPFFLYGLVLIIGLRVKKNRQYKKYIVKTNIVVLILFHLLLSIYIKNKNLYYETVFILINMIVILYNYMLFLCHIDFIQGVPESIQRLQALMSRTA